MYKLYKEECEENHQPFAKEWVYRSILNTAFNISFKTPQKDTCKTGDTLKIKIDAAEDEIKRENLEKQKKTPAANSYNIQQS